MKRLRELRFWLAFFFETLTRRRLAPLVGARLRGTGVSGQGLANVPRAGAFVIAANHGGPGVTLLGIAAILRVIAEVRPDAARDTVIIAGRRSPAKRRRFLGRVLRAVADAVLSRWSANLLRVSLDDTPTAGRLRAWRARAEVVPTVVFPEGRASPLFEDLRDGSGRWLASLRVATIPVAVYPEGSDWKVVIGSAVAWSSRKELCDVQLGLALAALLPADRAPRWQSLLARWRAQHEGEGRAA